MRNICLAAAMFIQCGVAFAGKIREFDTVTLEKLGNELCRRDEIAAKASDLVLERYPKSKLDLRRWITDLSEDEDRVFLMQQSVSDFSQAFTVRFRHDEKPQMEDHRGEPLPQAIALRHKALLSAVAAMKGKYYDVPYNFEVLNDPDGSGFLVYALAATKKRGEIITGGHYRITVSADGSKAEQIDLLSQLIVHKSDPGQTAVALAVTQLASNVPVETWIYSSCLYHMAMYVAGKDGAMWAVANGRIVRVDDKGPKNYLDILNAKAPETTRSRTGHD